MKDAIVFVEAEYHVDSKHDHTRVMYYAGPRDGWQNNLRYAKQYTPIGANRIHTRFANLPKLDLIKLVGLPYENETIGGLAVGWKKVGA